LIMVAQWFFPHIYLSPRRGFVLGLGFQGFRSGFRSGFDFRDSRYQLGIRSWYGFLVLGFGFRVSGFGFRVSGFGFRVSGFGFRVSGLGFRV
jgi:hypothetical protein